MNYDILKLLFRWSKRSKKTNIYIYIYIHLYFISYIYMFVFFTSCLETQQPQEDTSIKASGQLKPHFPECFRSRVVPESSRTGVWPTHTRTPTRSRAQRRVYESGFLPLVLLLFLSAPSARSLFVSLSAHRASSDGYQAVSSPDHFSHFIT